MLDALDPPATAHGLEKRPTQRRWLTRPLGVKVMTPCPLSRDASGRFARTDTTRTFQEPSASCEEAPILARAARESYCVASAPAARGRALGAKFASNRELLLSG